MTFYAADTAATNKVLYCSAVDSDVNTCTDTGATGFTTMKQLVRAKNRVYIPSG